MCASAQPCSQTDCLSCPGVPHGGRRQDSYQLASGLHPHAPAHNYPVGAGTELLLVPLKIQIELLFVCLFVWFDCLKHFTFTYLYVIALYIYSVVLALELRPSSC